MSTIYAHFYAAANNPSPYESQPYVSPSIGAAAADAANATAAPAKAKCLMEGFIGFSHFNVRIRPPRQGPEPGRESVHGIACQFPPARSQLFTVAVAVLVAVCSSSLAIVTVAVTEKVFGGGEGRALRSS